MYLLHRWAAAQAARRDSSRLATPRSSKARKEKLTPSSAFCEAGCCSRESSRCVGISRPTLEDCSAVLQQGFGSS